MCCVAYCFAAGQQYYDSETIDEQTEAYTIAVRNFPEASNGHANRRKCTPTRRCTRDGMSGEEGKKGDGRLEMSLGEWTERIANIYTTCRGRKKTGDVRQVSRAYSRENRKVERPADRNAKIKINESVRG